MLSKNIVIALVAIFFWTGVSQAQTAQEWFEQGLSSYEAGNYEEANAFLGNAVKADRTNGDFYKARGDCRLRLGLAKAALADFDKAESLGNTDSKLYLSRGAARIQTEDAKGAAQDFATCIEKDSSNVNAWFNRGSANYLNAKLRDAISDYDQAIALDPSFAEAYYFRGVAKSEHKEVIEGIADIEKAMSLDPNLTDGFLSIAIIHFDQKDYDNALLNLDKAISKGSDHLAEAYFYRAESKYYLEDREGACEDWQEAGRLGDPEGDDFYVDYCMKNKEKKPTIRRGNRDVISF